MPSSTSSSEREIPTGNWRATWLVALGVALGLTTWAERAVRSLGQRPSVVDDPVSWAVARRQVADDRRVVAFVGTSRMLLAYAPAAFRAAAPELRGVQLAINGVPAIGVLADLAADESFRGIAVVDVDEWDIAYGDPMHGAEDYVDRGHSLWRAPGALANRWLAGYAQERLAILASGGRTVVTNLARGKLPPPLQVVAARDRSSQADYSLVEDGNLRARAMSRLSNFATPAPAPDAWLARALTIEPLVQRIRAHGGDVVIVRLPVSGGLAAGFDEHYPRLEYWDAFAATASTHTLHFRDVPAMRDLDCADDMHLDRSTQVVFTKALVDILRVRGVLANR